MMNWEAISGVAEICGAFAVIVTLIYLAVQVKQGTIAMKGNTIDAVTDRLFEEQRWAAELSEIFYQLSVDPDSVRMSDRIKYLNWISAGLRNRQNEYYQHKQGALDHEIWQSTIRTIPLFLTEASARQWWATSSPTLFTEEFRIFVDELVTPESDTKGD